MRSDDGSATGPDTAWVVWRVAAVHVGSHLLWVALFVVGMFTGGSTIALTALYTTFILGYIGMASPFVIGFVVFLVTGVVCGGLASCVEMKPGQVMPVAFASLFATYIILFVFNFGLMMR